MSANISDPDSIADIETTNPARRFDQLDQYEPGIQDTVSDDIRPSAKASTSMAADRTTSTTSILPSEDNRSRSTAQLSNQSKNGRQSSQTNLLQIPTGGGGARQPVETSIWDWDTPLETVGVSSSYYYEPQGELLHEQREHGTARSEFSIPHALPASTSHWPFPAAAVGSTSLDSATFAVPRRPQGVPPALAGLKRKSTSDSDPGAAATQPDPKRALRIMSESGDEVMSPSEIRPPAHNTRSQGAPVARQRSETEGSESRDRPSAADADARSQSGTGTKQRRTLEDPNVPMVLPPRKVFPIQIGDKLFRLSGASISSDGKYNHIIYYPTRISR